MIHFFISLSALVTWFPLTCAHAAELEIATCQTVSTKVGPLRVELVVNADNHLVGRYSYGNKPMYDSGQVNFGPVETPPVALPRLLNAVNLHRDTGMRPEHVQLFQNTFIDGTGRWDIELWRLISVNPPSGADLKADQKTLGWVVYAFGELLGCD